MHDEDMVWFYVYVNCLFLYFPSGSFTVEKIQTHSYHHHLDVVCLNGDGSRSFSILIDMAFSCKGLTRLRVYCTWRVEML